ncbi:nucleotidyl transferase AbiEii/AbiGii toxin family protein [Candidatus Gottesmanbacteria bacterium]|nr:nucleotidyl transferase AbiEii/AbiGii toxin family protein [Candidatus Gottesmanbacteria bacterium]
MEQAAKNDELTRWYYLTGGTALSEFYLHHRLSEDIDFFTRSEVYQVK